jgi:D-sedoheptulose 7-phosphate isomerase
VRAALQEAYQRGLLALGLAGGDGAQFATAGLDFCFVRSRDPLTVQATHETLYHILWELVYIFSSTRDY